MAGESARFIDLRHAEKGEDTVSRVPQGQETSRSAVQVYKRLTHLAFQGGEAMLVEVSSLCRALEEDAARALPDVLESARILRRAGRADLAAKLLAEHSGAQLMKGLGVAEALSHILELRLKLEGKLNLSPTPRSPPQIW